MPLTKQAISINFGQGLDTVTDPNQLPSGKFVGLQNTVFIKSDAGMLDALKKRNGFGQITQTLSSVSALTTYRGSLIGLGPASLESFSANANAWTNQGFYQNINLSTQSFIKNAYSQTNQDSAQSPNGIVCLAYSSGDSFGSYKYSLFDSQTSQNIIPPTTLPISYVGISTIPGQVVGTPEVFSVGSSFMMIYGTTATAESALLLTQVQNISPFAIQTTVKLSGALSIVSNTTQLNTNVGTPKPIFDATVCSNTIFISFVSNSGQLVGEQVTAALTISSQSIIASPLQYASSISVCVDQTSSTTYTTTSSAYGLRYIASNFNYSPVFAQVSAVVSTSSYTFPGNGSIPNGILNIASYATNGVLSSFYEPQSLTPTTSLYTDNIASRTVTMNGVVGSESVIAGSLGLASRAFGYNGQIYMLGAYQSTFQNTYFLINSSGNILSRFAYGNGGGYSFAGLPSGNVTGSTFSVCYLLKDLLIPQSAQNQYTGNYTGASGTIFTQAGVNYATFNLSTPSYSRDTNNALSLSGGFLWNYDGFQAVENNFFLYPEVTTYSASNSTASQSSLANQAYQYQVTYEWTDNQANVHRSAPSLPLVFNGLGSGSLVSISIPIPTLRVTYKGGNSPVSAVVYRWSAAQQTFYKLGSYPMTNQFLTGSVSGQIQFSILQSHVDYFAILDTANDSSILGNEILYTNGNVIEDSAGPASIAMDVWDSRLWLISAEDGSLWYSKQIIPSTPIEMVQDFTLFLPPAQTPQSSISLPKCIFSMDDKQIIFTKRSILYIAGSGPDNTGANSQYSEPILITSSVGCSNQNSIVTIPSGLMFQSDNGIWLLSRDMSTSYIGKDVESFNNSNVLSAIAVPGTTEVRFSLDTGQILMFDYLVGEWTTFVNIPSISSVLYNNLHTYVNSSNQVFQETSGSYSDGGVPTVMSFTTGWINVSDLQAYTRAYKMYLLGKFFSPHTYTLGIAYDYNPQVVQTATIKPPNVVGSGSSVEQWQVNFIQQSCQAFQLTFQETASSTAGYGLSLSGIKLVVGMSKNYPGNIPATNRTS